MRCSLGIKVHKNCIDVLSNWAAINVFVNQLKDLISPKVIILSKPNYFLFLLQLKFACSHPLIATRE